MSNSDLIKLAEKAVFLSKRSRLHRIMKSPKKMILSKFFQFFYKKSGTKIKTKTFWGEDMLVVIPEVVSLNIYRYGFFEEGLTRMILEYLKPGMTFFDIGAHFGYYTLLGSFLVGTSGQVHAFEPALSNFNLLKANVSQKNNVYLNNCAVFSQKKKVFINDYGTKYSAYNSIYEARLPQNTLKKLNFKKYEVEAIPIDEYIEHIGIKPDFIKIDAESAEYEILVGMNKTIDKFHPIISIEVGDMGVENITATKDLINFLANRYYYPLEFKNGKILKHIPKDEKYQYDNLLFIACK